MSDPAFFRIFYIAYLRPNEFTAATVIDKPTTWALDCTGRDAKLMRLDTGPFVPEHVWWTVRTSMLFAIGHPRSASVMCVYGTVHMECQP